MRRIIRWLVLSAVLWSGTVLCASVNTTSPCLQEPTATCLLQQTIQHWNNIAIDDPDRDNLGAQLGFEARHFQLSFSDGNDTKTLRQRLEQEENFIRAIRQQNFPEAEQRMKQMDSPLDDFLQSPAEALYIEALILGLQDSRADQFKKTYYEKLLNIDGLTRTIRMISVARHEILGGQPIKGRHTLGNTDIDEFSASEFFLARRATELLATRSEQLFLQPDRAAGHCTKPAPLTQALSQLLLDDSFLLATTPRELPDPAIRIEALLLLARLHRNSEQCSAMEKWLISQAVSIAAQLPATTAIELLQNVRIARAIRRYSH